MNSHGGNIVTTLDIQKGETKIFERAPYYFAMHHVRPDKPLALAECDITSMAVYCHTLSGVNEFDVEGVSFSGEAGDLIHANNITPQIQIQKGEGIFIVAGVQAQTKKLVSLTPAGRIKKVTKPWGEELWLTDEKAPFALKRIIINAPHRTSLQYHRQKYETLFLVEGDAKLHHLKDEKHSLEAVTEKDLTISSLSGPVCISTAPHTLHRYEAVSNLVFYEASTPHLDDVVRVADDTKRPDGKIEAEHS